MTAQIIDGKALAESIIKDLAEKAFLLTKKGPQPCLAVIQIGEDEASSVYVQNKRKACDRVGIKSEAYQLPAKTKEAELLALVNQLNYQSDVHGLLIQLPLPELLDQKAILEQIYPKKDVDGFHPFNIGRLLQRRPTLRPCTPFGVMKILDHIKYLPKGKHAVVVGASNIVGRPMALEFLMAGATVTVCHRFTQNLEAHVKQADVLVVACGKPGLIPGAWIKPGAVVIDVGINRESGKLVGDVLFEEAKEVASWITPVPGGVGPMTVAMLMHNTLKAYQMQMGS